MIEFIGNNDESNLSTINYYEGKENISDVDFNNTFTGNLNLNCKLYYPGQGKSKEYTIEGSINNISLKVKNYVPDSVVDTHAENSQILNNDVSNESGEETTPTQLIKIDISNLIYHKLNCQFEANQNVDINDSKTHDHYETGNILDFNLLDIINDDLNKNKNYFVDSDNLKVKSESISDDNELNYLLSNKVGSFEHELMKGEKLTIGSFKIGDKIINDQITYKLSSKVENDEREKAKDVTLINGTDQKLILENEISSENIFIQPFYDVVETTITKVEDNKEKINNVDNECDNKYILGSYVKGDKEVQDNIKKLQEKVINLKDTDLEKYNECLEYLQNKGFDDWVLYSNRELTSSAVEVLVGLIRYYNLTTVINEENPSHTLIIKSSEDGQGPKVYDSFITVIKGDIKIVNETMNEQTINFKEKENDGDEAKQIQIDKLTIDSNSNVKLSFPESLTKGYPDIGTIELLGDSTISFENLGETTNPITLLIPYGKDISDVVVGDYPPTLTFIKKMHLKQQTNK